MATPSALDEQEATSPPPALRATKVPRHGRHGEEDVSMGTITSGVDLAKSVFPVGDAGGAGHVAQRQDLQREAFARWLAQRPVVNIVPDASSSAARRPTAKA